MTLLQKRSCNPAAHARHGMMSGLGATPYSSYALGIEITQTEDGYSVEVPVPGFAPGEIEVLFEDGVLSIVGQNERRKLSRSLSLPENIDTEKIGVEVAHGILTISLGVIEKAKPRKIDVQFK